MRFGPTIERTMLDRPASRVGRASSLPYVLLLVLALAAGCERKAADRSATAPDTSLSSPSVRSAERAPATPSAADSAEMVQAPAGRFIMGDGSEADATPHEVVVSAFS